MLGGEDPPAKLSLEHPLSRFAAAVGDGEALRDVQGLDDDVGVAEPIEELYLRICLSAVAPFAAVQQAALTGTRLGDTLLIEERVRAGGVRAGA